MSSSMDVDFGDGISSIVCMVNCLDRKERKEVKIDVASADIDVAEIRQKLASMLNLPPSEFLNLMVFGQKMEDGRNLRSFGLQKTSRLQAIIYKRSDSPSAASETQTNSARITDAKDALMKLKRSRSRVAEMMKNPEFWSSFIAQSEAFRQDYMAQVIMKDPSTLMTMLKQTNHEKIVDELFTRHPALIDAILHIHTKLPAQGAAARTSNESNRTNFFLDRADDDDDDDDDDDERAAAGPSQRSQNRIQAQQQRIVTSTQLQSALESALSGAIRGNSGPSTASPAAQNPASDPPPLNSESSAPQTLPLNPQSAMENLASQYQSQLQQIENLGITDRALSLQALYASSGDLQLALEIIYNSR